MQDIIDVILHRCMYNDQQKVTLLILRLFDSLHIPPLNIKQGYIFGQSLNLLTFPMLSNQLSYKTKVC